MHVELSNASRRYGKVRALDEVSGRVAGPVWAGAWAKTDKTAGVTLALEF